MIRPLTERLLAPTLVERESSSLASKDSGAPTPNRQQTSRKLTIIDAFPSQNQPAITIIIILITRTIITW